MAYLVAMRRAEQDVGEGPPASIQQQFPRYDRNTNTSGAISEASWFARLSSTACGTGTPAVSLLLDVLAPIAQAELAHEQALEDWYSSGWDEERPEFPELAGPVFLIGCALGDATWPWWARIHSARYSPCCRPPWTAPFRAWRVRWWLTCLSVAAPRVTGASCPTMC